MGSDHFDSYDSHTRKRVGKACDRCRLKKSKCDGAHPCTRCRLDNTICYYGERKKSVDKVYPKGYVEILELQQAQLVSGLRKAFTILLQCDNFPGGPLPEQEDGFPLTHDILDRLDVLHQPELNPDGADNTFEDDFEKIQERLNEKSSPRKASSPTFSDSESSHSDSQHPDSPTDSWVSSKSPRKRSHPLTPPTPQLQVPSPQKRQKHPVYDFDSTLAINQVPLFQEPIVMGSPQSFTSIPDLQFSGNFADDNMPLVFTDSYDQIQSSWPPAYSNPMDVFSMTIGQDPDFENFMRSGFHA